METDKLELKHLSGHLPYGVKIKTNNLVREMVCDRNINDEEAYKIKVPIFNVITGIGHKLILHPLSDLKKDEYFDLYMDFCEEMESISCEYLLEALIKNTKYALDINKFEALSNFMYKNHFDWKYGLIEKGLAIDINTLNHGK